MTDSLLFVLPDGRQARVSTRAAHQISERLWALGITPGASTAAVRIVEALSTRLWNRKDVAFTEREVDPLIEASDHEPLTWNDTHPAHSIPAEYRPHLLAKCDELIEMLNRLGHQNKLRGLLSELERLRNDLRSIPDDS